MRRLFWGGTEQSAEMRGKMKMLKEPNTTYNNQNRKIAFRKADLLKKKGMC